jgi:hypothetical protein
VWDPRADPACSCPRAAGSDRRRTPIRASERGNTTAQRRYNPNRNKVSGVRECTPESPKHSDRPREAASVRAGLSGTDLICHLLHQILHLTLRHTLRHRLLHARFHHTLWTHAHRIHTHKSR